MIFFALGATSKKLIFHGWRFAVFTGGKKRQCLVGFGGFVVVVVVGGGGGGVFFLFVFFYNVSIIPGLFFLNGHL